MNPTQLAEFVALKTQQDKAKYLLQFEITARVSVFGLSFVKQAVIGDVALPITGDSDEEVVAKAKAWLEDKAAA